MINTTKAPEFLLSGEILELFNYDCLVSSKSKHTPFGLIEHLLSEYTSFLGVRAPSSKQLGAFLTSKYPKQIEGSTTLYQCGINPAIIPSREDT